MQRGRQLLIGALLVVAYFASLPAHLWNAAAPGLQVPAPLDSLPSSDDRWEARAVSQAATRLVHASAMAELPDGRVRAVWFAGSREGAGDVTINSAVLDPESGRWTDERAVVTRAQLAGALGRHVRKLGNAVLHVDADGGLRLFVTTVSFGGWGASRIAVLTSTDNGESWSAPKLLVTTPFLNISNLVKGGTVVFADGSIGLPIYHEFLGKFGELLRLDKSNRVLGKHRIGDGRASIQPSLVVTSPDHAVAFLRNTEDDHGAGVWRSDSHDGGSTWSPLTPSGLPNPGSAVAALALTADSWLVAGNCNSIERDDLCINMTTDAGHRWQRLQTFHDRSAMRGNDPPVAAARAALQEELAATALVGNVEVLLENFVHNKCVRGNCRFQYDYPFLLRTRNGDIHMLYTWNKSLIRHLWWRAPATGEVVQ